MNDFDQMSKTELVELLEVDDCVERMLEKAMQTRTTLPDEELCVLFASLAVRFFHELNELSPFPQDSDVEKVTDDTVALYLDTWHAMRMELAHRRAVILNPRTSTSSEIVISDACKADFQQRLGEIVTQGYLQRSHPAV